MVAQAMVVSNSYPSHTVSEKRMSELERQIKTWLGRKRDGYNEIELAMEMKKCVTEIGDGIPSSELAEVLVSQLCFSNNTASLWKFLDHSLSCGLVYPLHVLSLLSSRIIPHRWSQPEAYRLFLELLGRYIFSVHSLQAKATKEKISKSIDAALCLSQSYSFQVLEFGHVVVLCYFSIVVNLVGSILDDCGLSVDSRGGISGVAKTEGSNRMDVALIGNQGLRQNSHYEQIRGSNTYVALKVLANLTDNQKTVALLRLVHLNMPKTFQELLRKMQCLEDNKFSSNVNSCSQLVSKLFAKIQCVQVSQCQFGKHQLLGAIMGNGSCKLDSCYDLDSNRFNSWVAFDVYMENAMDSKQLSATSAIDILTETILTLQVFNGASWLETFLALWISALRLVQRERDPVEGPIPHLETRLCILLSIVPLAIARVLEVKSTTYCSHSEGSDPNPMKQGLVSSLQALGQYRFLLQPPISVVDASNSAAGKAAGYIASTKFVKDGVNQVGDRQTVPNFVKAGGDLRHLIVEACIARNLIDTSVYLWPGFISASVPLTDPSPVQRSSWSIFMGGSPLTPDLMNDLIMVSASSVAEIEKIYHIAVSGVGIDKVAAAKILCGASLRRGWFIQEHVVQIVLQLLSPPIPPNCIDSKNHLVECLPMLSSVLQGASSVDSVHILSLLGVLPEVAAALVPLCEKFGSLIPTSSQSANKESSIYLAFSSAFLFLIRLWKFYRPPLEQCIKGCEGAIGNALTLEYLLLLRNSRIKNYGSKSAAPTYVDDYPKLKAWYHQNKSCVASTVSSLSNENHVHQVGNAILTMLYGKFSDVGQKPLLPAWDVLEAIPYVLQETLTAYNYGRLSSTALTKGLIELVDFLPACLATIVSYFTAEVTRGIWKLVPMNGKDWPNPSAILTSIEMEMKEILADVGVTIPIHLSGDSSAMLPLPMAALVSLTITFKLDKSLEYIHAVVGPALENCAAGCPLHNIPIVGSLWAQKVRRWHDFIVVSCSRSVFRQNHEALTQLLRTCFTSFLSPLDSSGPPQRGINSLLGSSISSPGSHPRVAPGFLFLRCCRTINHIQHLNRMIIDIVAEFSRNFALKYGTMGPTRLKSTGSSLNIAICKTKEVATLGASLICVAGGLQLVEFLYQESIPTWLLASAETKTKGSNVNLLTPVLAGYGMAYLVILSGASVWGIGVTQESSGLPKRVQIFGTHMDLIAGVIRGGSCFGCDPVTWKAYVSCVVGLTVSYAPTWIKEVKKETLVTLANGLMEWKEYELAISLLERGGTASMGSSVEILMRTGLDG